ncbi:MAG TPA: hypothetical protein VH062_20405 [Polyangiaceae bacterium]|jgi:hypothetical protein|nr:hypothetical protein [Polyangiaceae bacterium]
MADASEWASRVTAWRASGQTSEEFCDGREFTAGGLRHWAHRLGKTRAYGRRKTQPGDTGRVRLARVERLPAKDTLPLPQGADKTSPLTVELGSARVMVRAGFDPATLAAVLDVLGARGGAG